jgi:hypothetical protein
MDSKYSVEYANLYRNDYERALREGTIGSYTTLDQYIDTHLAESGNGKQKATSPAPPGTSFSPITSSPPNMLMKQQISTPVCQT